MQSGSANAECTIHAAGKVPVICSPVACVIVLYSCRTGISEICTGTTSSPTMTAK